MQLTIDETQAKELMRAALTDLLQERRDLFYELLAEVIEDMGMVDAIRAGRQNEFIDEAEIDALLTDPR